LFSCIQEELVHEGFRAVRLDDGVDSAPAMAARFDQALQDSQVSQDMSSCAAPKRCASCHVQQTLERLQDGSDSDKLFYQQLSQQLNADYEHHNKRVEIETDVRQGVDDDCESLAAELQLMEQFFFHGLPLPQGRRFFCPVANCTTHMLMGFGCVDSLCSHLSSVHQTTLQHFEARCGWPPVLLSQNLPLQSAQMFSEPNASLFRNVQSRSAFMNSSSKLAVGFVTDRKKYSLETLLAQMTQEKTAIQDRMHSNARAIQEREAQKLRVVASRRAAIGDLLPKLDSALARLKSETGSKLTQAILDIGNLAFHSTDVRAEIMHSNVLSIICTLLQSRSEAHREHAASAIKNLCLDLEHQRAVGKAGCIPPLVALLRGTRMQRKESLCALVNLVRGDPGGVGNVRNQRAVVGAGGLEEIRQINETANDSVRQLTESVLAWMETFDPSAVDDGSASETGDCDAKASAEIEVDKASVVSLERGIVEAKEALSKMTEFRAALPSMQVTHVVQPRAQQPAAAFQPRMLGSHSQLSSSQPSRPASSHDVPRLLSPLPVKGVRSAAVTQKYFTHIGNMDYTCNTCGVTVRDGTRDYHLKRYHPELAQRIHEDISSFGVSGIDAEKKVSVLSVAYDNLGDLNFKCRLCGLMVRDGSRDYHIKQRHSDRVPELKEQKRQLVAERRASESAHRHSQLSSPSTVAVPVQDSGFRSFGSASYSSTSHAAKFLDRNASPAKSHKKKEPSSEPREPRALTQWQIQELKKKGVGLRENEKLRNVVIESITAFIEMEMCRLFRNDDEG